MDTQSLTRLAALGTRHGMLSFQQPDYGVHSLVGQLGSDCDVAQLLITVASEKLREKAGFRPDRLETESNLGACRKLSSRPLQEAEAQNHLKQMVLDREWDLALPEWCLYLAMSGQHAPGELAPDLLNYGAKVVVAQEFLMMVMGDRARWMAEALERPEWAWATFTPILDAHKLALQERWKEPLIIDSLYDRTIPVRNHPALNELATMYYSLWSTRLADAFLYFVVTKNDELKKYYAIREMRDTVIEIVVRYPLNRTQELLKLFEGWQWHYEEMTQLFEFRRNMIRAIYRGKEAIPA